MNITRFWRINLVVFAVSLLFALHAPQDNFAMIAIRVVLIVILANAIIPKDTP